ncbi:MAG TPA: phosphotransferase [Acidimicrobiia bacterium]
MRIRGSWPVAGSVDELLAGATSRESFAHSDGKSGVPMERVVIDGEHFVVKHVSVENDWIMRATGDLGCRPLLVWRSGILERVPASIDHCFAGVAPEGRGAAILMRDVSPWLVPEGEEPISIEQHGRFLDHMAELHATFWDWEDTIGLVPFESRYAFFTSEVTACEEAWGAGVEVPRIAAEGWQRLPAKAPRLAEIVLPLLRDADPLVAALAVMPQTFVHGDWKMGNLGSHPDGRTILLDWAVPGRAPPCVEVAWYVALNRRRLPRSKENTIDTYRAALERHGIETSSWWETQIALALLGAAVQFGWEKAYDEPDELAWWEERAVDGARLI